MTAISPHGRPAPAGPVAASLTSAWRSLLKIKHVPEQLGDVIGIPVLFALLFTYLFGGALAGSTHGYLQFLLPGTLALAVAFVTVYSGVTLNTDLAMPIRCYLVFKRTAMQVASSRGMLPRWGCAL